MFKDVVEADKQKKVSKGELMANDQDAMEVCVMCYYLAHSPLGFFSGRLHQVLSLLFNLN